MSSNSTTPEVMVQPTVPEVDVTFQDQVVTGVSNPVEETVTLESTNVINGIEAEASTV